MYEKIRNYIIMGVRKSESRFFSPACGHCLKIFGEGGDFQFESTEEIPVGKKNSYVVCTPTG